MKSTFQSLLLFLIFGWSVTTFGNSPSPRGIWIWEEDAFNMLDNEKILQQVQAFLKQQHISILYLYADEFHGRNILLNEPDKYQKLIANAHAQGFKVFALLGSWYLRTQEYILPAKRDTALKMF